MISDKPTLSHDQQAEAQPSDRAVELPTKHCAFQSCSLTYNGCVDKHSIKRDMFMPNTDQKRIDPLVSAHLRELHPAATDLSLEFETPERAHNRAVRVARVHIPLS